jgi:hypothetical protein
MAGGGAIRKHNKPIDSCRASTMALDSGAGELKRNDPARAGWPVFPKGVRTPAEARLHELA